MVAYYGSKTSIISQYCNSNKSNSNCSVFNDTARETLVDKQKKVTLHTDISKIVFLLLLQFSIEFLTLLIQIPLC